MPSPTQRSLALLREQGYTPWIVEYWNAYARIRKDLYGFIDIVALKENTPGLLGVQTTSGSNVSARITKIRANPLHRLWLSCGNRIQVHGWRKLTRGFSRPTWQCQITDIENQTLEDLLS